MATNDNKISFTFLLCMLRKYWWLVLGISVLISVSTFYYQKQQPSLFVYKTTLQTDQPWSKEFQNELNGIQDLFNFTNALPKTQTFKQTFSKIRLDTLQLNQEAKTFQLRLTVEQQADNAQIDDVVFLETIQADHIQTQTIAYTFPASPILLIREKHPSPATSATHAFIVSCFLFLFLIAWVKSHRVTEEIRKPLAPNK
jgi:hypothetical protein